MDFLDELISPQQFNQHVDQGLIGQIETLIWYSSLDDVAKARMMKRMLKLESIEGAMNMITYLKELQPIPGFHRTAITQYEIVEATRRAVDMDDFKE